MQGWNLLGALQALAEKPTKACEWCKDNTGKTTTDGSALYRSFGLAATSFWTFTLILHSSARPWNGLPLKGVINYYHGCKDPTR